MSKDPDDLPQGGLHDDQVGYGKPPLKRRFKTSGNLSGRPKGAKNRERSLGKSRKRCTR